MNVLKPIARALVAPIAARPAAPRNRDFGVGYGRSSGYVSQPRYANNAFAPRFRLA